MHAACTQWGIAAVLAFGTGRLAAEEPSDAGWRYVLPPAGDAFEHPPLRAIGLSDAKPDDVTESVEYRGTRRRYAQLRYGSPDSVRVTVVLDEGGPGEADLYVDSNRNRRIELKERVTGDGRTWRVPLDVVSCFTRKWNFLPCGLA